MTPKKKKKTKRFQNFFKTQTEKLKRHKKILFISTILIVFFLSIILFPENETHDLFIEYLNIILSWPIIVFIISIILCYQFREPIINKLSGLSGVEAGKVKLKFQEQPSSELEIESKNKELEKKFSEERTKLKKTVEEEKGMSSIYKEMAIFEWIIRKMYKTQFQFLKDLREKKELNFYQMMHFYHSCLKAGGNKDYSISNYFGWLASTQLIELKLDQTDTHVTLTIRGEYFLWYCDFFKYSENEFIPI